MPPPEKLAALPAKYRSHIGKHEAHPGTGKGRIALERAASTAAD